jgi:hypothetical protein
LIFGKPAVSISFINASPRVDGMAAWTSLEVSCGVSAAAMDGKVKTSIKAKEDITRKINIFKAFLLLKFRLLYGSPENIFIIPP